MADVLIIIYKPEKQMQRYFKGRMGQPCKKVKFFIKLKDVGPVGLKS